jgi:hypothetical protein
MRYARVDESGAITQVRDRPPRTGMLSDGRMVSGLHQADAAMLADAGWLPVVDAAEPAHDPDHERVVAADVGQWQVDTQAGEVTRTWTVEPLPPSDPDDIKLAVLDPQQGLGRTAARRLIGAYPDLLDAVNSGNWQLLRSGITEAHQAGDLTDNQKQTIDGILDAHNVPASG